MEHIIHAAIRYPGVKCLMYSKDHAGCMKQAIKLRIDERGTNRNQGFLTNKFRFVLRNEALEIAIAAGQIDEKLRGKTLISEHFWNKNMGGKYYYDSVLGYIILAHSKKSENKPCNDSETIYTTLNND